MSFADERRAIESRLAANWTTTPIRYENAPFREDHPNGYVAIFIRRGEGFQASLGENPLERWAGLIVMQVFVPEDSGTQQAAAWCDTLAAIFNRQEFSAGSSGRIRCRVSRAETVGVRDGWFQMNVVTPYIRDKQS